MKNSINKLQQMSIVSPKNIILYKGRPSLHASEPPRLRCVGAAPFASIHSNRMAHKAILIILMAIFALAARRCHAQVDGVVADMKSRLPILGAKISIGNGREVVTDYRGHFRIAAHTGGATVSCRGYMQRRVGGSALAADTIFLIPMINMLPEVEVKASSGTSVSITEQVRRSTAAIPRGSTGVSFDFFSMFDKSVRHVSRKERERQKRILDNY